MRLPAPNLRLVAPKTTVHPSGASPSTRVRHVEAKPIDRDVRVAFGVALCIAIGLTMVVTAAWRVTAQNASSASGLGVPPGWGDEASAGKAVAR